MQELRQYIRSIIRESRFKQMFKSKFTDLRAHLEAGDWMNVDASGDYDGEYNTLSSDAQQSLIENIYEYFDKVFPRGDITLTVNVDHIPTLPDEGYNKVLKGATYFYDGLHNIELLLASMDDGQTLGMLGNVSKKVYEVLSHELLHMQQFLKYSKGNPTVEKWNQFKKSYEDKGGPSGMGKDYMFFDDEIGPSEMETFALQMALELKDEVGRSTAISALNFSDLDIGVLEKSATYRDVLKRTQNDVNSNSFREMLRRTKQYLKISRKSQSK
mgnify:CR=1 FL=1